MVLGLVCVPKPNGKDRICVDLTQLNKAVKREIHPMPSVDESLSKLGQGKVFSKLDANSGFWQVPLDEQSRLLTTFITPFGRFCFNRLPFGICSAPEIFQRTMSGILEGLDGTICQMDDVLIGGKDQVQHDERARDSVWWPGLSTAIQEMISKCNTCAKVRQDQKEPLTSSSFPSRPWERLGMDLFDFQGKIYLLVVDYYSRWLEIKRHSQSDV